MTSKDNVLAGKNQARRSIAAGLLTIALFAISATLLVEAALRAITILAAIAVTIAAFRGLLEALVEIAARKRGSSYLKTFSFVVPFALLLVSIYIAWIFWSIMKSDLPIGLPIELPLVLAVAAGVLNLIVIGFNAFSSD